MLILMLKLTTVVLATAETNIRLVSYIREASSQKLQ